MMVKKITKTNIVLVLADKPSSFDALIASSANLNTAGKVLFLGTKNGLKRERVYVFHPEK